MNKQDKIIDAAFLLSIKHGFDNVSIKQIQEEAKVTTGAIYYHFKGKNEILVHVLNKYYLNSLPDFMKIFRAYEGSATEKLKFIFYMHVGYDIINKTNFKISGYEVNFKDYHQMFTGISHQHPELEHLFHEYNFKILALYKETIKDLRGDKVTGDDDDLDQMALYICSIFRGFIETHISFPDVSLEKIIDKDIEIILDTIN